MNTDQKLLLMFALLFAFATPTLGQAGIDLTKSFARPPETARPWVYWFWLNGNITREGITADLEAMKRAGIGGALIMEVDQGVPRGPVDFMGDQWRELFKHAVSEAHRLRLEINMNDDAGWNGSGGPWITSEQSMQKLVWTELEIQGCDRFEGSLKQPETIAGFYRDIAVLAFPSAGDHRIPGILEKACFRRGTTAIQASYPGLPANQMIPKDRILDISSQMTAEGKLAWDAPPGKWTILRIGHTSTGAVNAPAPETGRGLECDKLSKEGSEAQFSGMMAKLIRDNRFTDRTLVSTHVDSWENGMQNWTARMRDEFKDRRGYDLLSFLPAITGRVVESPDVSERFLWDFRQTINDLVLENYAGHLRDLANRKGLRLSIEAYDGPCDDLAYAGRADEPMGEFWIGGGAFHTLKQMASAAHTYSRPILGAEAFTADDREKWLEYPGSIKALGDLAFCDGVNRFVFHRYAMQPWLDRKPGMTMGPWGLHYERTNTWWSWSKPWHDYLARCQHVLRQGLFSADICYLQPETAPQGAYAHPRKGYDYDNCSAEVLLSRMSVSDGRLMLPDGMSYRLLVLPESAAMTPQLLRMVRDLVFAGATVLGSRPVKSPSLTGYPDSDGEIRRIADELWGSANLQERTCGLGRVLCGLTPEEALQRAGVPPDFRGGPQDSWIHRTIGEKEVYFVASGSTHATERVCEFRVAGMRPELWDPETGGMSPVAVYEECDGTTRVPIRLESSGSVFVVFAPGKADSIVRVSKDGQNIWPARNQLPIRVLKALWGPPADSARTKDVTDQVSRLVDSGTTSFRVADLVSEGDPAQNVLKTLRIEYQSGGQALTVSATDAEIIGLDAPARPVQPLNLQSLPGGGLLAESAEAGVYEAATRSGKNIPFSLTAPPRPLEIRGPWDLHLSGTSGNVRLDRLVSWSSHADDVVRYFSGSATYSRTINAPSELFSESRRVYLDLGSVAVMARVKVNGKALGILWKAPYRVDVTKPLHPGENTLEIEVVNQWVNRLIGDEQLADDSVRNPDGTLKEWPGWVNGGKLSPSGRQTFTTWRLWRKTDRPIEAGLIGPVRLFATETRVIKTD